MGKVENFYVVTIKNEFKRVLSLMKNEYAIEVNLSDKQIDFIFNYFYKYYEMQNKVFDYVDSMTCNILDMANQIIKNKSLVDSTLVLYYLTLYQGMEEKEINKINKKMIKSIKEVNNER